MKNRKSLRKPIFLLFLIISFIVILFFIPIRQALVFQFQDSDRQLVYIPFSKEEIFKIKYTHSIHLSDVVESYQVTEEGHIQQFELMYEDYAIGMPEKAYEGEIFEQKDGKIFLKNMKRIFPYFDLRVGQVRANHIIIYKNEEYQLSKFIEPGTLIRIKFDKMSIFQQLKGVNIIEST